jgi:DNA repair ATPase RecN
MKVSTKNKILALLQENLNEARLKLSTTKSQLRSCEQNIAWAKKDVPKNDQYLNHVMKMKNPPALLIESCKKILKSTNSSLKNDRVALIRINNDINKAQSEIRKYNDLINEVSPFEKKTQKSGVKSA